MRGHATASLRKSCASTWTKIFRQAAKSHQYSANGIPLASSPWSERRPLHCLRAAPGLGTGHAAHIDTDESPAQTHLPQSLYIWQFPSRRRTFLQRRKVRFALLWNRNPPVDFRPSFGRAESSKWTSAFEMRACGFERRHLSRRFSAASDRDGPLRSWSAGRRTACYGRSQLLLV